MQLSDEFVKKIEIEYLRLLSQFLEEGKIDRAYAKSSAQKYLTLLPFESIEDIQDKIQSFGEEFPELGKYTIYVHGEIDELKTQNVLEKMRHMMKNDNIDEALNLVSK